MDKTIEISEELVKAAQKLTGEKDGGAAIEQIVRRVLAGRQKNKKLLELVGKVEFFEGYDPRALRS